MAGSGRYAEYIVMLVACSLAVSVLSVRLGRRLTVGQDAPMREPVLAA